MDPERAATPFGLATEIVSVHDRDPGMLGDSPPAPGVCAPPSSPQLRKSRSRRRKGSPSIETVLRVKAPAGRETVSARPSPPCIGPATSSRDPQSVHPQHCHPQRAHPQSGDPQTCHPQRSDQHPQRNTTTSACKAVTPPVKASGASDKMIPQYTLDHQYGLAMPPRSPTRRETSNNRTLTH